MISIKQQLAYLHIPLDLFYQHTHFTTLGSSEDAGEEEYRFQRSLLATRYLLPHSSRALYDKLVGVLYCCNKKVLGLLVALCRSDPILLDEGFDDRIFSSSSLDRLNGMSLLSDLSSVSGGLRDPFDEFTPLDIPLLNPTSTSESVNSQPPILASVQVIAPTAVNSGPKRLSSWDSDIPPQSHQRLQHEQQGGEEEDFLRCLHLQTLGYQITPRTTTKWKLELFKKRAEVGLMMNTLRNLCSGRVCRILEIIICDASDSNRIRGSSDRKEGPLEFHNRMTLVDTTTRTLYHSLYHPQAYMPLVQMENLESIQTNHLLLEVSMIVYEDLMNEFEYWVQRVLDELVAGYFIVKVEGEWEVGEAGWVGIEVAKSVLECALLRAFLKSLPTQKASLEHVIQPSQTCKLPIITFESRIHLTLPQQIQLEFEAQGLLKKEKERISNEDYLRSKRIFDKQVLLESLHFAAFASRRVSVVDSELVDSELVGRVVDSVAMVERERKVVEWRRRRYEVRILNTNSSIVNTNSSIVNTNSSIVNAESSKVVTEVDTKLSIAKSIVEGERGIDESIAKSIVESVAKREVESERSIAKSIAKSDIEKCKEERVKEEVTMVSSDLENAIDQSDLVDQGESVDQSVQTVSVDQSDSVGQSEGLESEGLDSKGLDSKGLKSEGLERIKERKTTLLTNLSLQIKSTKTLFTSILLRLFSTSFNQFTTKLKTSTHEKDLSIQLLLPIQLLHLTKLSQHILTIHTKDTKKASNDTERLHEWIKSVHSKDELTRVTSLVEYEWSVFTGNINTVGTVTELRNLLDTFIDGVSTEVGVVL